MAINGMISSQSPWLLESDDPSLLYQVRRDLMDDRSDYCGSLQREAVIKGWVGLLLEQQKPDGGWGRSVYNPKWTCTHYVLYELVQLGCLDTLEAAQKGVRLLLEQPVGQSGGINYAKTVPDSDVCVNGMILCIASYFGMDRQRLVPVVDYLLKVQMADGGWNCEYMHGAVHSSFHSTIGVLEGLLAYRKRYGVDDHQVLPDQVISRGMECILMHRLFRSDHSGEVIDGGFLKFPFPVRWKYDILRCLDTFQAYGVPYDPRMDEALDIIWDARMGNGRWRAASQVGKTYFILEKNGCASRWNTLRALRVLKVYRTQL